ncbi:MAG: ornithine carbamoyltransferase [Candidatus Eisenbacteria bacterium]|nr:ornithine carbamoyltransferase [Candidatus Eisenbacteria bacterium]
MGGIFKGRDWITTQEWEVGEITRLLELSASLKGLFRTGEETLVLPHKTIFLLFFDNSTRTRNSFEAGATQLGAHAHFISSETSQVAHGESPKDTGVILSRYGHAIAIRHDRIPGEGNSYMREVARWADVPVMNMQCDVDHPCQTLADLMTMRERLGPDLRGRKIAVSWAYTRTYAKPLSVPQGLITLLTRFGMDVVLAHPPEFRLMQDQVEIARENAERSGGGFRITHSMEDAFAEADIVYPKSWGCIDLFQRPEESLELGARYASWICDEKMMGLARPDALYMHCLPADRGTEVADAVIDGPNSVVYDEAENRLHTCKALMAALM